MHIRLLILLLLTMPLSAALRITEFSANSAETFADEDGDFPDWIEISNTGTGVLSTANYTLTDNLDQPAKWTLPSLMLNPGEFLVIFASGKDRALADGELHTNFSLDADKGDLAIFPPPGGGVEQGIRYPKQFYGISYSPSGYFATPTPGAANGPVDFTGQVKDTKFSHDRGFYEEPFNLSITTATPDAAIYYTTDGSEPSPTNGTLYTSPIPIQTTAIIRALAVKEGLVSTNIDGQTFLFLKDIIQQPDTIEGFPSTWGKLNPPASGPRNSDYAMDSRVVEQFGQEAMINALKNHPTISVVMDPDQLWNESEEPSTGGIYSNPFGGTGTTFIPNGGEPREWEKPCSVEFIGFEREPGKQVLAGIRMAGNFARKPNRYKHHFRLTSRRKYGPSKIKAPLFSRTNVDTFDDLILRGGNSESWTFPGTSTNNRNTRRNVQYVRDQFYKDAQVAMGHLSANQEYFHLYLNGAYWGFYTLIERVDAHFLSQHLGGEEEDYDVLKQENAINDGNSEVWEEMFSLSRSGLSTPEKYAEIQQYLDIENIIDYVLFNFWAGTVDWSKNWRGGRRRADGFGFQFYNWDGERGLGDDFGDLTERFSSVTREWSYHATELNADLRANLEYRIRFADHVQKHLFGDGILTPENAAALYNARIEEIRPSLIAEAARWGDLHRSSRAYTTENEWAQTLNWMNSRFFPRRTAIVIRQLQSAQLYPRINAPIFNQHGGVVSSGFNLEITRDDFPVYFTADGSDPRLEGGAINPAALSTMLAEDVTEVITAGDTWIYNDSNIAAPIDWTATDFDSSAWKTGNAPIGYGEITDTTLATTVINPPVTTIYFRKTFNVSTLEGLFDFALESNIDGGAIYYLNGTEIYREGMPAGSVTHDTLALTDGNEGIYDRVSLPSAALVEGTNVLAIELHNDADDGDDLVLDIRLITSRITGPDLTLTTPSVIKARTFSGSTWSALVENTFLFAEPASQDNLVISELLYNPSGTAEDDEFIELLNISDAPISLAGVKFTNGINYSFPLSAELAAGERLILRPTDYTGFLSNSGERIRLEDRDRFIIQEFSYKTGGAWPNLPDGDGPSLVLANPMTNPDPALAQNWIPSPNVGGSPGTINQNTPPNGANLLDFFLSDDPTLEQEDGDILLSVPRDVTTTGARVIVETSRDLSIWEENAKLDDGRTDVLGIYRQKWKLPRTSQKTFARVRVEIN